MNETIYTITLDDGTVIDNLVKNGDNFISLEEIDPDIFEGNLAHVTISDGEAEQHYDHMALVQVTHPNQHQWWFILRQLTDHELTMMRLTSAIQYVGMMTDVDLDDIMF